MNEISFILKNIENFLNHELHPDAISGTLALKPASDWIELCRRECNGAIKNLKCLRYQLSEVDFERHIQLNYADTLSVIDCIRDYELRLKRSDQLDEHTTFYPDLIASMQTLFTYMEGSTSNCYEPGQLLPEYEMRLQFEEIRQQNLVLRAKCKSKEIDPTLQRIVNDQVEKFLHQKTCSYRQLSYTKKLIKGLTIGLSQSDAENWTMVLIRWLITLNFNDSAFYEYCKHSLTALADQEQAQDRQCMAFRYYHKEIQTLLPKANLALKPETAQIKTSLLHFLEAELHFREIELLKQAPAPAAAVQAPAAESTPKLKLNTNMRQLAIGLNIGMQMDVFVLENLGIKGLLGFFVKHVSTIGSENLSIDSLQKRISEKNTAAALGLLKMLEKMVEILRRDYLG
jgi:hypothetical protein